MQTSACYNPYTATQTRTHVNVNRAVVSSVRCFLVFQLSLLVVHLFLVAQGSGWLHLQ